VARVHVFADEGGNFDFSRRKGASRYFILTTVTLANCTIAEDLLALRRQLAWDGHELTQEFHATEDQQAVRDAVFGVLAGHEFQVDATIFDKSKTQPHLQNEAGFYKLAWSYHFRNLAPRILAPNDELFVVAAALGTRRLRAIFRQAVDDVVSQGIGPARFRTQFWPAASDPCLQVADYCCWAVQRKWEGGDDRSYVLIRDKIVSEYEMFNRSSTTYY